MQSCGDVEKILFALTDTMKSGIIAQFISKREKYVRKVNPKLDSATITKKTLENFDTVWQNLEGRLRIVPGKKLLAALNREMQDRCSVTLTALTIVGVMRRDEIPDRLRSLISRLDDFRRAPVPEGD